MNAAAYGFEIAAQQQRPWGAAGATPGWGIGGGGVWNGGGAGACSVSLANTAHKLISISKLYNCELYKSNTTQGIHAHWKAWHCVPQVCEHCVFLEHVLC